MRTAGVIIGLLAIAAALHAQDALTFGDDAAASLFRTARMNVSGREATVRELLSLRMAGAIRIATPDGAEERGSVEVRVLLPDRYLRIDATGSATRYSGFDRDTLLNAIRTRDGVSSTPELLRGAALQAERRRLAYLLLGAATYVSRDLSPVMYSAGYGAGARVIEGVDAEKKFLLRLAFGDSTVPVRVEYTGGGMTFADRRMADGLQLPFRITTTGGGGRLVDEIVFDSIRVNGDMSDADFRISAAR